MLTGKNEVTKAATCVLSREESLTFLENKEKKNPNLVMSVFF
jgi:hypothetical protein